MEAIQQHVSYAERSIPLTFGGSILQLLFWYVVFERAAIVGISTYLAAISVSILQLSPFLCCSYLSLVYIQSMYSGTYY